MSQYNQSKGSKFRSRMKKDKEKVATIEDRDKISQKIYNENFKDISIHEAQLVNSELLRKGYKLSKDEPSKKEIEKEMKQMHKKKIYRFRDLDTKKRINIEAQNSDEAIRKMNEKEGKTVNYSYLNNTKKTKNVVSQATFGKNYEKIDDEQKGYVNYLIKNKEI